MSEVVKQAIECSRKSWFQEVGILRKACSKNGQFIDYQYFQIQNIILFDVIQLKLYDYEKIIYYNCFFRVNPS
ncbi:unknown [Bacteroides sp. CAG:702]|nr:unknown [Bacteroides sp. CAG:702]